MGMIIYLVWIRIIMKNAKRVGTSGKSSIFKALRKVVIEDPNLKKDYWVVILTGGGCSAALEEVLRRESPMEKLVAFAAFAAVGVTGVAIGSKRYLEHGNPPPEVKPRE